ncbi:hypothetical protein B7H19_15560 [Pseudomonas putida]|uniref:head-tail joining protein n=2 Tax=Pseudomonas TaxID=286 RepID=UPI00027BC897|nr:hypothetical protein [Pseudomonas putida]EJT83137.1 hypothetical protein PPS11_39558 [Pseudomonas putida S11]ORL68370.1 hypothetical protein B7H19_15560 [Pseudomonas putida]
MARPSFRERMAVMSARILDRVGDRATLEGGTAIMGTFENPFLDPQMRGRSGKGLATQVDAAELGEPRFSVLADVAQGLPRDSVLTIALPPAEGGGRYRVVRPEPTGDGMVALVLEEDHERTADIL